MTDDVEQDSLPLRTLLGALRAALADGIQEKAGNAYLDSLRHQIADTLVQMKLQRQLTKAMKNLANNKSIQNSQ